MFFESEITEQRKQEIMDEIVEQEIVYDTHYVSAEEAWEEFQQEYLEDSQELAAGFEDNPLKNSDNYEVYVKATEEDIQKLISNIKAMDGVRKVNESSKLSGSQK